MHTFTGRSAAALCVTLASVALLLSGCWIVSRSERQGADDLAERVAQHFERCGEDIPAKEGATPTPMPYVEVDTVSLSDDTQVSLWVSDLPVDSPIRTRCFYLDHTTPDGGTSTGVGGGGGIDDLVTLNRERGVLYGSVGTSPAVRVRLEGPGASVESRVVRGHFLIMEPVLTGRAIYTLTLMDANGGVLAVAQDLLPPAAATPSPAR